MDVLLQEKIKKSINANRVLKTIEHGCVFYHVINNNGRQIMQLAAPRNGVGVYDIVCNGQSVFQMLWRPEFAGNCNAALRDRHVAVSELLLACDKKYNSQIIAARQRSHTK